MGRLILRRNPLNPSEKETYEHTGPLIDWLQEFTDGKGFGSELHVRFNNGKIALKNLDREVLPNDVVELHVTPAGAYVVYFVVSLALSAASYYFAKKALKDQPEYTDRPEPNSVYSTGVTQNKQRLGLPIPVIYGAPVTVPDLITSPYTSYDVVEVGAGDVWSITLTKTDTTYGTNSREYPYVGNWPTLTIQLYIGNTPYLNPDVIKLNDFLGWTFPPITIATQVKIVITRWNDTTTWYGDRNTKISKINSGFTYETISGSDWVGNYGDQYSYHLLCVGQGQHEITDVKAGDSKGAEIPGIEYTVVQAPSNINQQHVGNEPSDEFNNQHPSGPPFYENVITASGFEGAELSQDTSSIGPYPVGSQAVSAIEVDVSFDRGLYRTNSEGSFLPITVGITIQVIDQNTKSTIIVRRANFGNYGTRDVTPIRRTLRVTLNSNSLCEVKITRDSTATSREGQVSDTFSVAGVRGIVPVSSTAMYGNTTLLLARIKATEFTSTSSASRITCKAKRINLPYSTNHYNSHQDSSNPADVVTDIMMNEVYGARGSVRNLDELDSDRLSQLSEYWEGSVAQFNATLNEKSTLFEAIQSTLAPVGASPVYLNGQLSASYEGVKNIRTQVFGLSNIVDNSLRITYAFNRDGEPDGYEVEYLNEQLQKLYGKYPANASNPRRYFLLGCTSPQHALDYARFLWETNTKENKLISFETGMEGLIPRIGDKIGISHDLAEWGQSGEVITYDQTTMTITLDEDVTDNTYNYIMLRGVNGSPTPPLACTVNGNQVVLSSTPPFEPDSTTHYAVGTGQNFVQDALVTVIEPLEDTVKISCINYNDSIFTNGLDFMSGTLPKVGG